jgi:DNA-binding Xre family transcriptional regulator
MIRINLRKAMEAYQRRNGVRLTYPILSKRTSISVDTLQSIAARPGYNTRLSTIERLCRVLECTPGDLLELPKAKGAPRED